MRKTKQIKRIMEMEEKLDAAREALDRFQDAMRDYARIQDTIDELERYYYSDWRKDYDADEAGKFPPELKRGVLSEDALYDVLTDNKLVAADALYTFAQMLGQGQI